MHKENEIDERQTGQVHESASARFVYTVSRAQIRAYTKICIVRLNEYE